MGDEHGVFVSAQEVLFAEGVEGDHLGRGPAPSQDDAAADIRLTRGGYVVGEGGGGVMSTTGIAYEYSRTITIYVYFRVLSISMTSSTISTITVRTCSRETNDGRVSMPS